MPDFGIFRGFNEKLFGDKLVAGQLPTQLGLIGSANLSPLLLDTYSGAAAAYSLRLLSSTYTGDAIRVRRADNNTEQDIGFVNNELDTSTLQTFCSGTDGFIKTWYDQSGNGYDASQTTAANQPQIVSSGSTITENGKPTVQFAVDNNLNNYFNLYNTDIAVSQPFTTFIAATRTSSLDRQVLISELTFAYNTFWRPVTNVSNQRWMQAGTNLITGNISNGHKLFYNLFNSTNSEFSENSGTVITGNSGSNNVADLLIGGLDGEYNWIGNIQEIILYSSDQSSNRTGIQTNINDFYSIY